MALMRPPSIQSAPSSSGFPPTPSMIVAPVISSDIGSPVSEFSRDSEAHGAGLHDGNSIAELGQDDRELRLLVEHITDIELQVGATYINPTADIHQRVRRQSRLHVYGSIAVEVDCAIRNVA